TEIRDEVKARFGYNLSRSVDEIRRTYQYDVTCQGSVPESLIGFFESNDFTHAIRLAVSFGGDIDTMACITGSIAEAFYGDIPESIVLEVIERIPKPWVETLKAFSEKYR
ncbi:MAG: hypothetical protein HPY76_14355, partial [Anaerolineae bacterium]|nr:hypothetical protein [Anaerolineae bacterium]